MTRFRWLLTCILVLAACPASARVWTDIQGRMITGDFVHVVKGRVVIAVNGQMLQVPFGHLAPGDQEFVREELEARGLGDQVPARKNAGLSAPAADSIAPAEKPGGAKSQLVPERIWTDSLGRKVQARLVGMDGASVVLHFNGQSAPFPFDKFSDADQNYVRMEMTARGEGDKVPEPVGNATAQANRAQANTAPTQTPLPQTARTDSPSAATTPQPSPFQFTMPTLPASAAPETPRRYPRLRAQPLVPTVSSPGPNGETTFTRSIVKRCSQCGAAEPTSATPGDLCPHCRANGAIGSYMPFVVAKCDRCGGDVTGYAAAGKSCPHCGAYFLYDSTPKDIRTRSMDWGFLRSSVVTNAIICGLIGGVLGMIGHLIRSSR